MSENSPTFNNADIGGLIDADGEELHIGDEIILPNGTRDKVRFVTLNASGWYVNEKGWIPEKLRHYHKQSTEDVLREYSDAIERLNKEYIETSMTFGTKTKRREGIDAEYASKLRLRGKCHNTADDGFRCSSCKSWVVGPRETNYPTLLGFRYCPTCGDEVIPK